MRLQFRNKLPLFQVLAKASLILPCLITQAQAVEGVRDLNFKEVEKVSSFRTLPKAKNVKDGIAELKLFVPNNVPGCTLEVIPVNETSIENTVGFRVVLHTRDSNKNCVDALGEAMKNTISAGTMKDTLTLVPAGGDHATIDLSGFRDQEVTIALLQQNTFTDEDEQWKVAYKFTTYTGAGLQVKKAHEDVARIQTAAIAACENDDKPALTDLGNELGLLESSLEAVSVADDDSELQAQIDALKHELASLRQNLQGNLTVVVTNISARDALAKHNEGFDKKFEALQKKVRNIHNEANVETVIADVVSLARNYQEPEQQDKIGALVNLLFNSSARWPDRMSPEQLEGVIVQVSDLQTDLPGLNVDLTQRLRMIQFNAVRKQAVLAMKSENTDDLLSASDAIAVLAGNPDIDPRAAKELQTLRLALIKRMGQDPMLRTQALDELRSMQSDYADSGMNKVVSTTAAAIFSNSVENAMPEDIEGIQMDLKDWIGSNPSEAKGLAFAYSKLAMRVIQTGQGDESIAQASSILTDGIDTLRSEGNLSKRSPTVLALNRLQTIDLPVKQAMNYAQSGQLSYPMYVQTAMAVQQNAYQACSGGAMYASMNTQYSTMMNGNRSVNSGADCNTALSIANAVSTLPQTNRQQVIRMQQFQMNLQRQLAGLGNGGNMMMSGGNMGSQAPWMNQANMMGGNGIQNPTLMDPSAPMLMNQNMGGNFQLQTDPFMNMNNSGFYDNWGGGILNSPANQPFMNQSMGGGSFIQT